MPCIGRFDHFSAATRNDVELRGHTASCLRIRTIDSDWPTTRSTHNVDVVAVCHKPCFRRRNPTATRTACGNHCDRAGQKRTEHHTERPSPWFIWQPNREMYALVRFSKRRMLSSSQVDARGSHAEYWASSHTTGWMSVIRPSRSTRSSTRSILAVAPAHAFDSSGGSLIDCRNIIDNENRPDLLSNGVARCFIRDRPRIAPFDCSFVLRHRHAGERFRPGMPVRVAILGDAEKVYFAVPSPPAFDRNRVSIFRVPLTRRIKR